MNLQQSLEHYYQSLTTPDKGHHDPRLNSYFLDVHDLTVLIYQQIQKAIEQHAIPTIHFKTQCLKEEMMAVIIITITGGLDDFPVYKPQRVKKWQEKGIPKQNGLIESAWYSKEFQCLEKILTFFMERYNFATDAKHLAAKRYWTMLEIDEAYEETLMKRAVQRLL